MLDEVVSWYLQSDSFHYVPKGRAFSDINDIQTLVKVLSEIENEEWDQRAYWRLLKKNKLTQGDVAVARMIRNVLNYVGFTYNDKITNKVIITEQGRKFSQGDSNVAKKTIENQLWKLRLNNLSLDSTEGVSVTPVSYTHLTLPTKA